MIDTVSDVEIRTSCNLDIDMHLVVLWSIGRKNLDYSADSGLPYKPYDQCIKYDAVL